MKKYILLLIVIIFAESLYSQTITIKDEETNESIEGVAIFSRSPFATAVTNVNGQAEAASFKQSDEIQISCLGYKKLRLSFTDLEKINFEVFLEPSNLELDEVVVSATRWRQNTADVPSKIVSISAREMTLQNPQTAADLLGMSGKVFIQKSQQGGGSPMINGFSTNRLLYTVDGVRMNTAIFRGGNLQNVINLDPFATENTEVLFGPGSVIYGSDAIGGVMSFQTLTPQFSYNNDILITGKAAARYSSANKEKTAHFDVNIGWKKWALVSSFTSWDYDHLKQGSHGPDDYIKNYFVQRQDSSDVVITQDDPLIQIPSAYSQINFMQKIRFSPNENLNFEYGFHFSETSQYGRYDRHNRVRKGTARYAEWNYGPQKWLMNNFILNHNSRNHFYDQAVLRAAQQSFEESRINRSLNKIDREFQIENVEAYSINLDLTKSINSNNTFYYGFEFVLNDVKSAGTNEDILTGIKEAGPSRYPKSTWKSLAAYINDEMHISSMLTLQAGIRYNQYILNSDFSNNAAFYPLPFSKAEINSGSLMGSIGAVMHPTESWVIRANVGTAFRSPNVDDIGKIFDSEPGAVVVPNPNLKAEFAYNFDMGIAKVFENIFKVELNGYYTILNDALVRRNSQLNGRDSIMYDGILSQVQSIQNAAEANVYGLQAGIEVKFPFGFSFSSDINYQKGEEELDNGETSPSRHAAPLFGVSRIIFQTQKLNIQLYAEYQGERKHKDLAVSEKGKDEIYALDKDGNTYSPSWYTLNIKTMYSLTDKLTLSAGVENITDQRYRPYSSGISGAGRNFILFIKAAF